MAVCCVWAVFGLLWKPCHLLSSADMGTQLCRKGLIQRPPGSNSPPGCPASAAFLCRPVGGRGCSSGMGLRRQTDINKILINAARIEDCTGEYFVTWSAPGCIQAKYEESHSPECQLSFWQRQAAAKSSFPAKFLGMGH